MAQESDDIGLLTEIASLYYEENYTQERIAKIVGVSRSGISRLLTRSRELGLVDIQVHHSLRTSSTLRDMLVSQFGLKDAQVLLLVSPDESPLSSVAEAAARYIDRHIQELVARTGAENKTIGISWGISLSEMLRALRPQYRRFLNVVQLMGSVGIPSLQNIDGPEIARQLASVYGTRCYYLYAPLLVPDSTIRDVLLKERSLYQSFQMMTQMDMALIGIGGLRPEATGLFRTGYLGENELRVIRDQEVVGEMPGCYFTIEGRICATGILSRTVGVSFEVLRKVPLVIAVAPGIARSESVLGALRTGLIDVLITDEFCARAVLGREAQG